jgi:hypothetical protein
MIEPRLDHALRYSAGGKMGRAPVDRHDGIEVFGRGVECRAVAGDAGGIHEHVERAIRGNARLGR